MKSDEMFDIAVVGAGAAGFLAAIMAKRTNPTLRVLLLDSRQKIGAKILVSGGTRCNVTNVRVLPSDYQGGARHFVKHVLEAFKPEETMQFFKEIGVELVLEPTGKYFPTTHSGKTVLEALQKEVGRLGVELKTGAKIDGIKKDKDFFILTSGEGEFWTRRVILCTGGLSYPETGSDGTGLTIAKNLGHSLIPTFPSLTPLFTNDEGWKSLSGVTLEAELLFFRNGKKEASSRGSFLFTHFGFSGPSTLDISRHFAVTAASEKPEIYANFIPDRSEASTQDLLNKKIFSDKSLKNFLVDEFALPSRFAEVFIQKTDFDPTGPFRKLSAAHKRRLIHLLRQSPLNVASVVGYKKAEVTAGGVDLKEVSFSTMESKKVPGLYFSGEILDVDGRIGGFNFQWAWSSGTVAGRAAARSLKS